jgi:Ni/Fe-hydrogenase subunit HybB-like protein
VNKVAESLQPIEDPNQAVVGAGRPPVIAPGHTFGTVTDKISAIVLTRKTPVGWYAGFGTALLFTGLLLVSLTYLVVKGIGIWGNNIPVGWAFDITNFVWWIGIGHAGTLISAILLLLKQTWRTSINRFAEAMTLFAVACAGIFPLFHTGRPWLAYWLLPYPNTMNVWPQFRSPLIWDVFAVSTYATVSLLFWFVGLIPDLATLRDRSQSRVGRVIYGMLAMGWRGSAHHWHRYETAYLLLAGLATPLVVSVHTVVSFDFAVGIVPGWHTTIFPPYFVAGAIFGGFAMVLTLLIPARAIFKLHDIITPQHIDKMAKIILLTGSFVSYAYAMEFFVAWYSGNAYERFAFWNRIFGPYWWYWWVGMLFCNILSPQLFWFKWCRRNILVVYFVCNCVNAGMWFERFIIIVGGLHRDFIPSSWGLFIPTWVDIWTFIGTLGIFTSLFLLFIRFLPMIAMSEVKIVLPEADPHSHSPNGHHPVQAGGMERV